MFIRLNKKAASYCLRRFFIVKAVLYQLSIAGLYSSLITYHYYCSDKPEADMLNWSGLAFILISPPMPLPFWPMQWYSLM